MTVLSILLAIAMVIGPVLGYIDQYLLIRRRRSSAGFNSVVCAVLLFANILRVFFWLGKRFDVTLLLQSIVMIIAQLILLELVVRYQQKPSPTTLYGNLNSSSSSVSSESLREARPEENDASEDLPAVRKGFHIPCWSWDHYLDYINFLLAFTAVVGFLYLFLARYPAFTEVLGMLSLGIESTLPLPQFISNYIRQSTAGFSLLVLGSWFLGDSFKLFYFAFTQAPLQFIICGSIQLFIDTAIVVQFAVYSTKIRGWFGQKPHLQQEEDEQHLFISEDA